MPATEETLRTQRLMHSIFAVSGIVMLLVTIWMFAADHSREWKAYQRTGRRVARELTRWDAFQYQTNQAVNKAHELQRQLEQTRQEPIDSRLYKSFKQKVDNYTLQADARDRQISPDEARGFNFSRLDRFYDRLQEALNSGDVEQVAQHRHKFVSVLQQIVDLAKAKEKEFLRQRKFTNANYDAAKATLGMGVRDRLDDPEMQRLQHTVDELRTDVTERTATYEESNAYRVGIQNTLSDLVAPESKAESDWLASQVDLERLETAVQESEVSYFQGSSPFLGKRWLEMPILDAFNSPLVIDNHHYPLLTVDYNFKGVARYDRCTTCHRAIDKASADDPTQPAFLAERTVTLRISTPDARPEEAETDAERLRRAYGIRIAQRGLIGRNDVTVSFVRPSSLGSQATAVDDLAADEPHLQSGLALRQAMFHYSSSVENDPLDGLQVGDVIAGVNGNKVVDQQQLFRFLLETADWGDPLTLTVQRGLPQPYAGHPRIDLFVGPNSPHPLEKFGCTSCHEGQGSATAFKWGSHTPNDLSQRQQWGQDHGWFNNHHWIFPMYPKRFAEATCIRCHHEVTDLEASHRYPEPPAPKVSAGHRLITMYGCFGCHEVNGYNGPDIRVGPDLRLEPNFYAAALQLKHLAGVRRVQTRKLGSSADAANQRIGELDEIVNLAQRVGSDWEHQHAARRQLVDMLAVDVDRPADDPLGVIFPSAGQNLARALKDVETPGTMRKVGPSLRYVGHKLDATFLYDWIREPKHFRPSTKMPQFFGRRNHLFGGDKELSQRLEPIEIHGIVTYLLQRTQAYEFAFPREGVSDSSESEKIERGKLLFETRGCLGCHTHRDFPDARPENSNSYLRDIAQGPDLSALGDKLVVTGNVNGPRWLVSWLRNPSSYHARTRMPNMLLEPLEERDVKGNVTQVNDPAEDIAEYLLSDRSDWQPVDEANRSAAPAALEELVLEHLSAVFHQRAAAQYLVEGIPESMRAELKGAEVELIGDERTAETKNLLYVGRKAIAKYGCYGCHDIPGFEDAKPIGTGLADWGRKDPSKLDFAHITHLLHDQVHGHGAQAAHVDGTDDEHAEDSHADNSHDGHYEERGHPVGHPEDDEQLDPYFVRLINEHDRAGFAMQKLRQPRSYDFKNVTNKSYNERLRMPRFPLSAEQREAVVTFVLGLTAQPPVAEYVHRPEGRTQAIVEGRQVLEKYNCGGCHVLEPERWSLAFQASDLRAQPLSITYPFMPQQTTADQRAASLRTDRRDRMHGLISGFSSISNEDGLPVVLDDEGDEVDDEDDYDPHNVGYRFDLWKPTLLEGNSYDVGVVPLEVRSEWIQQKYAPRGGHFTRYLLPRVVELEHEVNPSAKGSEAWSWLPPPLIGQGRKTQSDWLHNFLLDPHPIRPAVFLRMPRFNMSSAEATRLVNYFAAMDNAEYPYEFDARMRSSYVAAAEHKFRERLQQVGKSAPPAEVMARFDHALKIVTNNNFCVKCHIIGDPGKGGFQPEGPDRAKAPNLAVVFQRLRPEYVRRWIAKPQQILSYSGMPVNIPFDPAAPHLGGVSQDIFPGTSIEQLDGLVDLLMNYDIYSESRSPVTPLIEPAPPTAVRPEEKDVVSVVD